MADNQEPKMGEKLTDGQAKMLRAASLFGGVLCGYSRYAKRTAAELKRLGFGTIYGTHLGPALAITTAGRQALDQNGDGPSK